MVNVKDKNIKLLIPNYTPGNSGSERFIDFYVTSVLNSICYQTFVL